MLNQCNFIGRLGDDPQVRYLPDGKAAATISIGCSEKWKDKQTQEQKERTEWVRCTSFGKLAEIMGEYLRKGSLVYVSGKMQTKKWQDQNGQDRYTTEIVISEMKMLGSKSDNQGAQQPQQGGWGQPQQQQSQPQYAQQPKHLQQSQPQYSNQQHQSGGYQQHDTPPPDFDDD